MSDLSLSDLEFVDLVPPSLVHDPKFQGAARGAGQELQAREDEISSVGIYYRLAELSEPVVDHLAAQFHVDFYPASASLAVKRALVAGSIAWHMVKGTNPPMRETIEAAIGLAPVIEEKRLFLCDRSRCDSDPLIETPDNLYFAALVDRDAAEAAAVVRKEAETVIRIMKPEGTIGEAVFVGMRCDDPVYSQTDRDRLGA